MTVSELRATMTTRELAGWRKYARQRGLSSVRLQWQLALLTYVVARVAGNEGAELSQFVIDFDAERKQAARQKVETAQQGGAIIGALAGAGVYRLGQRKKRG